MIEKITHEGQLLAIILPHTFQKQGIHFFTENKFSQQLAYMSHPAGKQIEPHVHNKVERQVLYTQEVLFIKKGRLRVDFYDTGCKYIESRVLETGDVILLAAGGHGFEVLDPVEIVEVKQGPYYGDSDKTRFEPVAANQIVIK